MGVHHTACVLDGTPILLGQAHHLPCIRHQAIAVRTIRAVDLFDDVQISQMGSVVYKIIRTSHTRHVVQGKTNPLVKRDHGIEQHHGQEHRVDQRHGQQVPPVRGQDVAHHPLFEAPLLVQHLVLKLHRALFEIGLKLLPAPLNLLLNVRLQLPDAVQKFIDLSVHDRLSARLEVLSTQHGMPEALSCIRPQAQRGPLNTHRAGQINVTRKPPKSGLPSTKTCKPYR